MSVIEVTNLTKIYQTGLKKGNVVALDSVSLTVKDSEIYALLGPNGAGKTTLVKILLGVTRKSSGSVEVRGRAPEDPLSRNRVGYLGENYRFPAYHTGLSLLELACRLHGMAAELIPTECERLLATVGLEKWAGTKIAKYSKGMLQRLGLAQAMVNDPDLLILDEPTDGVDPIGRVEIRSVLTRLRGEGKTIFLNSHLLSEVESVADRVAILSKGKLLRVNRIEELTSRHHQFKIEADFGDMEFEIPPEIGRRLQISTTELLVELQNDTDINYIIDQLRIRKVSIRAVSPVRISLEQSFIESVTATPGVS